MSAEPRSIPLHEILRRQAQRLELPPERQALLEEIMLACSAPAVSLGMSGPELASETILAGTIVGLTGSLLVSPRDRRRRLVTIAAAAIILAEQLAAPYQPAAPVARPYQPAGQRRLSDRPMPGRDDGDPPGGDQ